MTFANQNEFSFVMIEIKVNAVNLHMNRSRQSSNSTILKNPRCYLHQRGYVLGTFVCLCLLQNIKKAITILVKDLEHILETKKILGPK